MLVLFAINDIMIMPKTNVPRLNHDFGRYSGNQQLVIETIPHIDHFFRHGELCLGGSRAQAFAPDFWTALGEPSFWKVINDSQ